MPAVIPAMDEGQVINKAPGFEGSIYDSWKTRIEAFSMSQSYYVWHATVNGVVTLDPDNPSVKDKKVVANDSKAKHVLFCALRQQEFTRFKSCKTTKEMWDSLQVAHEGNKVIKENKIQLQKVQYEVCKIEDRETIAEYMFRINNLVKNMRALGEDIKDVDVCKKILRSLTSRFNPKVTILEDKDLSKVKIDEFQASLTAYEMRIGVPAIHKREAALKTKEVVEKTEAKSEDDLEEDEVAYLAKKFRTFRFKKKNKLQNLTCYGCGKPSHVTFKCPNTKGQIQKKNEGGNYKRRFGRKAIISDWDAAPEKEKLEETQEDEFEEDSDTEIEEILKECERLTWSTKKFKEELPLILEERSLKVAEIWKQSTKQIGKTGIGYVCDSATKVNQTHFVFVKAIIVEVYARFPIIKPRRFKDELLNNTCNALNFSKRDFITIAIKNFKITRLYVKKFDLASAQKVNNKGSLVKTKMMWIHKKLNSVSLLVYTDFKTCNTQDIWHVDSGCSRRITGDGSKFNLLKQFDGGNVIFGDNQRAKIVRIGTMSKSKELPEIPEVLLDEGLKHNLLSVSQLWTVGMRSSTVKRLRYDFGSEFIMKEFKHYCDDKGIKKEFLAVATP
ncbi:uncharacterized protein LOC132296552 [Cornus florida]|uniref:uncharacterized protein LOC132296552 n=1 Tax=Cornus florida TaxID=4283 RepID=UPI0028A1A848|nr:uncharacterized protein LOC132296552 [Cornus florida]